MQLNFGGRKRSGAFDTRPPSTMTRHICGPSMKSMVAAVAAARPSQREVFPQLCGRLPRFLCASSPPRAATRFQRSEACAGSPQSFSSLVWPPAKSCLGRGCCIGHVNMLCSFAFDAPVVFVSVSGRVSCRLVCYRATIRHACAANGSQARTTLGL